MRKAIILGLVLASIAGCANAGDQTIDGSSKENYERSLKALGDQLNDAEKEAFAKGLMNLALTRYPPAAGAEGFQLMALMAPALENAHITLDGVPVNEIIERGREILAQSDNANQAGSPPENAGLKTCLESKVLLTNARVEKGDYSKIIGADITNNLDWPIAAVSFHYTIKTKGRSVPWAADTINIEIPGGIESGETRFIGTTIYNLSNEATGDLLVEANIIDVADVDKSLLLGAVKIMGWSESKTSNKCE